MATDTGGASDDEMQLSLYAAELVDGVDSALGGWVERCVRDRCAAVGTELDDETQDLVGRAVAGCRAEVVPRLRELLGSDIDDQRSTPLAVVREGVRFPTRLLAELGVPPERRDEFDERAFPDDPYSLSPASLAELDPALGEVALRWGAAKAYVHLARRRTQGLR